MRADFRSAILPRTESLVAGHGGCVFFLCREETPFNEPADCVLCGAFAEADVFGELLIADLDFASAALGFGGQPEIDEKARGPAVVAGQVAHKDLRYVWIDSRHAVVITTIAMKRQLRWGLGNSSLQNGGEKP